MIENGQQRVIEQDRKQQTQKQQTLSAAVFGLLLGRHGSHKRPEKFEVKPWKCSPAQQAKGCG
jgi:hypothetical protein